MVGLSELEKDVAIIASAVKWGGIIATAFVSTTVAFGTYVEISLKQNETSIVVQQMQIESLQKEVVEIKNKIER
jgi:hypothetical protein